MARLDKHFFDVSDLARDDWREKVKEAQKSQGIQFNLENDDAIEQRRVAIDTPEDAFESAKDGKPVNDKMRCKCELCAAGGDWQQGTYYFRIQKYEGGGPISSGERFCIIVPREEGNWWLMRTKDGFVPRGSDEELRHDWDEEKRACWKALPGLLRQYKDEKAKKQRQATVRKLLRLATRILGT